MSLMRTYLAGLLAAALGAAAVYAQSALPRLEVYKSPTCGCCEKWVEHVEDAGFRVRVTDMSNLALDALKDEQGVPPTARSCHTALIGGYVVEGHVPAAEIKRLLDEKPAVKGIAVGGMPIGSPGMEVPGRPAQTYNVVSFDAKGAIKVFSTQNP